jgi:YebC/PmpR family DNA-binding regulatory protein
MGRAFEFRKARKFKRWAAMAKTFARLNKDLIIAIREGNSADPEMNPRLRAVLQNCRAANMPKENVERAIKKATDKDTSDYKQVNFEGYGPHGIAIYVETATDNNNRTVANVRSHFNKCNGNLGTSGSVEFMFDHLCFFKIIAEGVDTELLELELIDFGAEDVDLDGENISIYGSFESFGNLQKKLEEEGYAIVESGLERLPNITKELSEEETSEVEKLIDKLEEDDDVQNVFHTMSSSSPE